VEKRKELKIELDPSKKVYNLIEEYLEKKAENLERFEKSESNVIEESEEEEIVLTSKPLFKKTLSRMVAVQMYSVMLNDDRYQNNCSENALNDLIQFIVLNNNYEWPYFKNKQIAKNFIFQLINFVVSNIERISKIVMSQSYVFKYDNTVKAIMFCIVGEYLMIESAKQDDKDYKNILLNEYILISEYFIDENCVKLLNGALETVFKNGFDNESDTGNIIESFDTEISEIHTSNIEELEMEST
jgi:transcription termination factor NusB